MSSDLREILNQTESILEILEKIPEYERHIEEYVSRFESIGAMCRQPNPDWMAILSTIIDVLTGEDHEKSDRDEHFFKVIEKNLSTLDVMQRLAHSELKKLSPDSDLGAHAEFIGIPFMAAVSDARQVLMMARDYKRTVEGVTVKFDMLKRIIEQKHTWDIAAVIATALDMIAIIQEEDIVKRNRGDAMLDAMQRITVTFQGVTHLIDEMETSNLGAEMRLGGVFSIVTDVLSGVLKGINAVRDHQKTINDLVTRYTAIAAELRTLAGISSLGQVVPCLLRLIRLLKEEDSDKIARDRTLIDDMNRQNTAVTDLTHQLKGIGYTIV